MIPVLTCAECGGNRFAYPFELTDAALVHCEDCMASVGTVAELTDKIVSQLGRANQCH